jgi:hypothetical protein
MFVCSFSLAPVCAGIADLACSVVLYESIHNWSATWNASALWQSLLNFTDDSSDVILFAVFRVLAITVLGFLAMSVGVPVSQRIHCCFARGAS